MGHYKSWTLDWLDTGPSFGLVICYEMSSMIGLQLRKWKAKLELGGGVVANPLVWDQFKIRQLYMVPPLLTNLHVYWSNVDRPETPALTQCSVVYQNSHISKNWIEHYPLSLLLIIFKTPVRESRSTTSIAQLDMIMKSWQPTVVGYRTCTQSNHVVWERIL